MTAVIGGSGVGELSPATRRAAHDELSWLVDSARAPAARTIRQFAEQEIVIPEGKFAGWKWRAHRQPYGALLFDCLDRGPWRRRAILGCVQSGKTFHGFAVLVCYYLFEMRESVVCGVPTMDVAHDKWNDEIRPVIERTRYAGLLPASGAGSRGGTKLESVTFRHGPKVKFMSGRGRDEKRSGFTARVMVATEVDKFDTAGSASREADPVSQLEARTASYDVSEREISLECTVSIEEGRIWQEYLAGTATRIIHPCPHCAKWVSPEREHLHGWQEAETKIQAGREGFFYCPDCGEQLTDEQRYQMVQQSRLIHRGQELAPDGTITGEPAETDTLGFRWSAFQNLFWTTATIAAEEWSAARAEDEENAKKKVLQFYWATPYKPPLWDETPLSAQQIKKRFGRETKGLVPEDAKFLTVGVDMHKRFGAWIAIAWREDGSGHVVDYGYFEVLADDLGVERAICLALDEFRENIVLAGWQTRAGQPRIPEQVWIDAGYQTPVIFEWVRRQGTDRRFRPCLGRGAGQQYAQSYGKPKKTGAEVKHIGDGFHISMLPKDRVFCVEVNSDRWKSALHERLATPEGQPGALVFFHSTNPNEHTTIAKQIGESEKIQEEFKPGKGLLRRWVRGQSRANHYFDAGYLATCAGYLLGVRIVGGPEGPRTSSPAGLRPTPVRMPDGRAFLVTER